MVIKKYKLYSKLEIYGTYVKEATHIAKKVLDNYDRKKNGF